MTVLANNCPLKPPRPFCSRGYIHWYIQSVCINYGVYPNTGRYILEFLDQYLSLSLKDFELLNIKDVEKVELVSHNEMEFNNLLKLDEISADQKAEREISEQDKTISKTEYNDDSVVFI